MVFEVIKSYWQPRNILIGSIVILSIFLGIWIIYKFVFGGGGRSVGRGDLPEDRVIQPSEADTRYPHVQGKIVNIHNYYRSNTQPPATNMLAMSWHTGAQQSAQSWAETCHYLIHDPPSARFIQDYGNCGQNILVSVIPIDWEDVAKWWHSEVRDFKFGSYFNRIKVVGHYTQMVWYNSYRVGCGFHFCGKDVVKEPFYNYICNYCPGGNDKSILGWPYEKGTPCAKCPQHCREGKLCTNSCPYTDDWNNCAKNNKKWNNWLCENKPEGCKATCRCPDAIH